MIRVYKETQVAGGHGSASTYTEQNKMPGRTTETAVRQVWTSDEGTMAYETARKRWPRIVQDMVNDVALSCSSLPNGSPERVEGASIQQQLASLKDDIVNDARIE